MTLHNINVIARYEVKLLKRSWLFRIFAILALLGITAFLLIDQTSILNKFGYIWPKVALSSLMPFTSICYYNIAQSIIVIFLAGSFLKRDKKLDTAEVIYVRPMSNADYILGKTWGIVKVFVSLNLISLLITAFLNLFINNSPFNIFYYLFYLVTISVPSLLFVLGLSFTLMCLLKNQAVTFIVMLGIIGLVFFYLTDTLYGVFDFFGGNIPAIFSDVTGHADLRLFLLQRLIYLLSALGFISFTIALVKRLPHKPWKTIIVHATGAALVAGGCLCALLYVLHYEYQLRNRNNYIDLYNRYAQQPSANIVSHDLTVIPDGHQLKGESELKLINRHAEDLNTVVLYLNPSLRVSSVESEGRELPFTREGQVLILQQALPANTELTLTLKYEGTIDETVCYTDVLEKEYVNTKVVEKLYRFGKRYAWLEKKFTLLTPECLWYPIATAPAIPIAPYNIQKDFTRYTLTVVGQNDRTVLSQGEPQLRDDRIVYTNRFPLPGISLTIADYEKKSLQVDSVNYEIYHFKGHDYFSAYFTQLQDTLPALLSELKNDIEVSKGRYYPFGKFILAETPVQFSSYIRNWKGSSEYIQPEIVFVPERGSLWNQDFKVDILRNKEWRSRGQGGVDENEILISCFRQFAYSTFLQENIAYGWNKQYMNPFNITPMFFGFNSFVSSNEFPVIDIALTTMQNTSSSLGRYRPWAGIIDNKQRANLYLETHSLEMAIADTTLEPEIFYELLKLKSEAIRNYITSSISQEELNRFLKDFFSQRHSMNIPFDSLNLKLQQELGVNLTDFIHRWYKEKESPTLLVREADANEIIFEDFTKYQVKFKVYNPSQVDAILTAQIQQGEGFGGGRRRGGRDNSSAQEQKNYIIPAQTAHEIKIITDERPANLTISTNISHNLPTFYNFNFSKIENTLEDTVSGIFPIDPDYFRPNPNEIIIDNEDPGFKIIASNSRHKLKDLFKKKDEEKYKNFMPWWLPSQWTYIAANYCYGETICSAVYKNKGSGANAVEWHADIPHDGYYEVAIWNPKMGNMMFQGRNRRRGKNERNQTYTVQSEQETESLTLDLEQESEGWVSLGNFYFPRGTAKIRLSDKVSGDYVIADAVKFTFTD